MYVRIQPQRLKEYGRRKSLTFLKACPVLDTGEKGRGITSPPLVIPHPDANRENGSRGEGVYTSPFRKEPVEGEVGWNYICLNLPVFPLYERGNLLTLLKGEFKEGLRLLAFSPF